MLHSVVNNFYFLFKCSQKLNPKAFSILVCYVNIDIFGEAALLPVNASTSAYKCRVKSSAFNCQCQIDGVKLSESNFRC